VFGTVGNEIGNTSLHHAERTLSEHCQTRLFFAFQIGNIIGNR